jgi:hypothetical protein
MAMSGKPASGDTPQSGMVSDEVVTKVGAAAGKVAMIQQEFNARAEAGSGPGGDDRQELAEQAQRAAIDAISQEGITVDEYNTVLRAAEGDSDLEQRLLAAAREAI